MQLETQAVSKKKFGLITFKSNHTLSNSKAEAANGYQKRITIDWGDFHRNGWDHDAPEIQAIQAKEFYIWHNDCPSILRELSHIKFQNLTILIAIRNRIISLQILQQFELPALEKLNLQNNLIVNSRALAKVTAPQLKSINMKNNPICHNENIFKANFNDLKEYQLPSQNELQKDFNVRCDPVLWAVKVKGKLIQEKLYMRQLRRPYRQYNSISGLFSKYRQALNKK